MSRRPPIIRLLADAGVLAGAASIVYGISHWSAAAAWVVAGLLACAIGCIVDGNTPR